MYSSRYWNLLLLLPSHPVIINKFSHSNSFLKVSISYLYYFFCSQKLLTHGGVEVNPGPKKSHSYFSCCHWNVNTLIMVCNPSLSAGRMSLLPNPNFQTKKKEGGLDRISIFREGLQFLHKKQT